MPEKAIALYGRNFTERAISNWRNINPIKANEPCKATNAHKPPN